MKASIVILSMTVLANLSVYAQGTVAFANNAATRIYLCSMNFLIPVGSTFQAELMYAPDGTPVWDFEAVAVRLGSAASFGPLPGVFSGGTRTAPINGPGGFGLFQVRVWETAFGSSWREIRFSGSRGRIGESAVLRVDTGDPTTVPPGTPTSLPAAGLTSFIVGQPIGDPCIPEPSTFLLALLGSGAVWCLRCRR